MNTFIRDPDVSAPRPARDHTSSAEELAAALAALSDQDKAYAKRLETLIGRAMGTRGHGALVSAGVEAFQAVAKAGGLAGSWRRVVAGLAPFLADPEFTDYETAILEALRPALAHAPQPDPPPAAAAADPAAESGIPQHEGATH